MDGRKAAESLLEALQLEKNEFRIGMTKVCGSSMSGFHDHLFF